MYICIYIYIYIYVYIYIYMYMYIQSDSMIVGFVLNMVCVCVPQMAIWIEHILINHQMLDYPIFRHTLPWVLMTVWICIVSVVSSRNIGGWCQFFEQEYACFLSKAFLTSNIKKMPPRSTLQGLLGGFKKNLDPLGWSHIWPTNMPIHSSNVRKLFSLW